MQRYWDQAAGRAEQRGPQLRDQARASAQASSPDYASVTEDFGAGRNQPRVR